MIEYSSTDFIADIGVEDFIARFRDGERFLALCMECPNYGNSWGCPPFTLDPVPSLSQYKHACIIATKVIPTGEDIPLGRAQELIKPEKMRIQKLLLEMEKKYSGRAFAFSGKCLYCGDAPCQRGYGKECLHSDKVRPSLEAFGFDIGRALDELFGIKLIWSENGYLPRYLVLVTALFHNSDDPLP